MPPSLASPAGSSVPAGLWGCGTGFLLSWDLQKARLGAVWFLSWAEKTLPPVRFVAKGCHWCQLWVGQLLGSRKGGLQPHSSFCLHSKGWAAGQAPHNPTNLTFYLQKPPGGPPGPAQRSSKWPRSQHYVSLPSLPFSLLSCLKPSGSPCTHPESSSLCESPHQSPAIDLTSVISAISPATEQILGSYQPIKESKNAVTSFLSAKRTQSPADYSINLLMNLSCQTDSQRFCEVGMGNFNLPGGAGPGLTRL